MIKSQIVYMFMMTHCLDCNYMYILSVQENYLQEPVNCNDESDVIGRKSDRGQYNYHGDQACLRDASGSNAGRSGCDTF